MSTPDDKHFPLLASPRRRLTWAALGLAATGTAAWAWHRLSGGQSGRFFGGPSRLPDLTYTLIDGRRIGAAELLESLGAGADADTDEASSAWRPSWKAAQGSTCCSS